MSLSFKVSLFVAVLALIPMFLDHGETHQKWKSSTGWERIKNCTKFWLLWLFPVAGLIAVIASGYESVTNDKEQSALKAEVSDLKQARDEAVSNRVELMKRLGPRTLTGEQYDRIKRAAQKLDRSMKFRVEYIQNTEPERYATQLFILLKELGFTIVSTGTFSGSPLQGIRILYPEQISEDRAGFLLEFLQTFGSPGTARPIKMDKDEPVTIEVGEK